MRQPTNPVHVARQDSSSVNITTSYSSLIASMNGEASAAHIYWSGTVTIILAIGAVGSETQILYVTPSMDIFLPVKVPKLSRVAIKSVSGTVSSGEIDINFFN